MTEKELRKLNRKQLLELLLRQTERTEHLQKKLNEAEEKIKDKLLIETEAGSIAEASLKLNGVFEAAEAAASQYLENIKRLSENSEILVQNAEEEAVKRAEEIVADAQKRAKQREEEAEKKLNEINAQIEQMYRQKRMLDDIFKDFSVK